MKRLFLTSVCCVFSFLAVLSQDLDVKDFKLEANDPAATQFAVKDFNGKNCALVIVGLAVDGVEFEGNIIKQERKSNGEYWVYITEGSMEFQINSKDYLPKPVTFVKFGITKVESGRTYRMNVEHPDLAKSYDELIDIAREYSRNYRDHTESSYFLAAVTAYDQAIAHNDCPQMERDGIFEERNRLAAIRKMTYYREKADTLARKAEAEHGFNSEETYKMLSGEYNIATKLIAQYPEIEGFKGIKQQLYDRLIQHPGALDKDSTIVTRQRQQITGRVSFKNEYAAVPFNTLSVYASSTSKIVPSQSKAIGKVKADGTFKIVVPDNMKYIFVDGEKKEAHYITPDMETIDIVIK